MEQEQPLFRQLIHASSLGIHLVSATVVGGAIGYFLDKWLGTQPWLLLVFFFIGIGTGFRDLFHMIKKEEPPVANDEHPVPWDDGDSDDEPLL